MPHRIVLSARARRDLEAIHEHTATEWSLEQAARYVGHLRHALERLAVFPGSGPALPGEPTTRLCHVERHRILYRVGAAEIRILRILHQAQDLARILRR